MWWVYEKDGVRRRVAVARSPAGVWVGYPGGAALVKKPEVERASAGPVEAGAADVRAPMTGRVVQMMVQVGDTVAMGAPLLLLEAMKMEYRLTAPQAGEIATLSCKQGDLVDLGVVLVTLKQ